MADIGAAGIFFCPADIAADIGKVGKPMDAEVWDLVKPAAHKSIAKGLSVATLVFGPSFATKLFTEGFSCAACGTDANLLATASNHLRATVKGGLACADDEGVVSNGARLVLCIAMMTTLEDGDAVLMCAPHFRQYTDVVLILRGKAVVLECPAENGFRATPAHLDVAITPKTRWIMLNLPSNPACAVYSDEDLHDSDVVFEQNPDVLILSDEIYRHILFDGRTFPFFCREPMSRMCEELVSTDIAPEFDTLYAGETYARGDLASLDDMKT